VPLCLWGLVWVCDGIGSGGGVWECCCATVSLAFEPTFFSELQVGASRTTAGMSSIDRQQSSGKGVCKPVQ
jgi:hypothetical protein